MDTYKPSSLWLYLAIYCGLAVLLHIPGLNEAMFSYGGRQQVIVDALLSSPALLMQVAGYVLIVLVLNLLPLALLLISLRHSNRLRTRLGLSMFTQFLLATVSLWTAVLLLNKAYFPHSSFAILIPFEGRGQLMGLGWAALAVYVAAGILPALGWLGVYLARMSHQPVARVALAGLLAFSVIPPLYSAWTAPVARSEQPNIIIIGLDSVSPLHLQRHPGKLPILEKLLAESTVFEQAITPLARTFPAWTSILTARYPAHSGARFNLTHFDQVETRATLPNFLKSAGYRSIYAQDERQFNNIDETFGFERVIGPQAGAADFVLAKSADHPLANLTLLTPWAETLFPFVALNRAAAVQYDPGEFIDAIIDGLPAAQDRPLFLAAHFCLAHNPYLWRDQHWETQGSRPGSMDERHIYALQHLERQVEKLLHGLRDSGRLDNAILVILSDHGEALGYDNALWPSVMGHHNPHDTLEVGGHYALPRESGMSGHGTNTLDRSQYHSILAFRGFGRMQAQFPPGRHDRVTSLVDVAPTLLGALGQPMPAAVDGIDLMTAKTARNTRAVTAETGLKLTALASVATIDVGRILQESHQYYRVDPDSGRLSVRPEFHAELKTSKDLAVHTDDWLLALLRKPASPQFPHVAVLVHKPTGAWTLGGDTALIAKAPLALLARTLHDQYGDEIADFRLDWPFGEALAAR